MICGPLLLRQNLVQTSRIMHVSHCDYHNSDIRDKALVLLRRAQALAQVMQCQKTLRDGDEQFIRW